jgi:hypothetical protein
VDQRAALHKQHRCEEQEPVLRRGQEEGRKVENWGWRGRRREG